VETITHAQANYNSSASLSYDISPTRGYHPTYALGGRPYTSPVGSFAPNEYGLYDMAGNMWEWYWDWWWSYYSTSSGTDPQGPPPSSSPQGGPWRVLRGGSWNRGAGYGRTASRSAYIYGTPGAAASDRGFRSVRR
jgi:formylglycine-generating enzyme